MSGLENALAVLTELETLFPPWQGRHSFTALGDKLVVSIRSGDAEELGAEYHLDPWDMNKGVSEIVGEIYDLECKRRTCR